VCWNVPSFQTFQHDAGLLTGVYRPAAVSAIELLDPAGDDGLLDGHVDEVVPGGRLVRDAVLVDHPVHRRLSRSP
jgi:hypothetical protein